MTALMDKMYIKLEQKDIPYKPQIYQEEVKDRIGKCLDKVIIGEEINHLVETTIIEDMEEVEVIFGEVILEAGLLIILEEMIVEVEKEERHGDSLD